MPPIHPVTRHMFAGDAFSQWLGITVLSAAPGACELEMRVRPEMLNGFGILHGGVSYSLADSALAFASNSHGRQALSIETSISHVRAPRAGELLRAVAAELSLSPRIGIYQVRVADEQDRTVALFKGTVFRTERDWELGGIHPSAPDPDLANEGELRPPTGEGGLG